MWHFRSCLCYMRWPCFLEGQLLSPSYFFLSSTIRPHLNACVPTDILSHLSDSVHTTLMLGVAQHLESYGSFFRISSFTWQYSHVSYLSFQNLTTHFLLSLYNIPLQVYIIFCLSTHLLRNILPKMYILGKTTQLILGWFYRNSSDKNDTIREL